MPVLIGLALLGGVRALTTERQAQEQLAHAGEVRIAILRLTDAVVDAETGQRGFLLTDDPVLLRSYNDAVASCAGRIRDLRRLIAAEPTQRSSMEALERRVPDKLDELAVTMKAHHVGERDGALAARLLVGQNIMVDIRRIGATMQVEQERLVALRAEEMQRRARDGLALFILSSLALMILASFVWIRRARAEERAASLERMARWADEFIAILGHDLRNPLGAITMGARLLHAGLHGQARDVADRIQRSCARMNRMIEQLLDLARSRAAGGIPVTPAPVNISDVVSHAVSELQAARPDRRIELEPGEEIVGIGDADRLSQLVSNLVGNAVVHGDPARPVDVRLSRSGERVVLEVHNFGPPIDEQLMGHLFEPYRQGRGKSKSQGLGLGLFISHEIARAHGGDIRVESSPERGTTFTAWLPEPRPQS